MLAGTAVTNRESLTVIRTEDASATAPPAPRRPPAGKLTYEQFLEWADEDTWAEWVDGEVILLMPASTPHQLLVGYLHLLLRLFCQRHHLGVVLTAPFQMRLAGRPSGREPDLLVIRSEHLDRLQRTRLEGPADLVVEVISPESETRDRQDKPQEYEAAGVAEYWMLDPDRRHAEFLVLGSDGRYHQLPVDAEGVVRSAALPGFWLRVAWLWQDPLPDLEAVQALGLLAPASDGGH
jgi:Uma2 family endonuclease